VSDASKSIKGKQLPAHSVSLEIYSGIARFPATARLFCTRRRENKHVEGVYFLLLKWDRQTDGRTELVNATRSCW